MSELIEFETERLRLRQWCEADRKPFAALNADPRVMEFFQIPLDRTASDAMADRCQSLIEEHGWGFWAVETKFTPAFIGFVGLHTPTAVLPFSPCIEIGWRLAYQYWEKGFATEAALGALRVGFEILDLSEIVAFTAITNLRSRSVMEKLNMHEATDTFGHPDIPADHKLHQHCLYRLLRGQLSE